MYYVKVYNSNNDCYINAPFNFKEQAIKYFNYVCEFHRYMGNESKRFEIYDENTCLFDYEV